MSTTNFGTFSIKVESDPKTHTRSFFVETPGYSKFVVGQYSSDTPESVALAYFLHELIMVHTVGIETYVKGAVAAGNDREAMEFQAPVFYEIAENLGGAGAIERAAEKELNKVRPKPLSTWTRVFGEHKLRVDVYPSENLKELYFETRYQGPHANAYDMFLLPSDWPPAAAARDLMLRLKLILDEGVPMFVHRTVEANPEVNPEQLRTRIQALSEAAHAIGKRDLDALITALDEEIGH